MSLSERPLLTFSGTAHTVLPLGWLPEAGQLEEGSLNERAGRPACFR